MNVLLDTNVVPELIRKEPEPSVAKFAETARKKLQRSAHRSVAELEADITSFIDAHNENPRPCKWVKSADEILASVRRFCLKMNEPGASENV